MFQFIAFKVNVTLFCNQRKQGRYPSCPGFLSNPSATKPQMSNKDFSSDTEIAKILNRGSLLILRIDTEFWSCISDYMSRLLHSHSDHTSEPKCWWLKWRLLVVSFSYYSVTKLVNLIRCLMTRCLEHITMKVSWNLQTQNTKCGVIQMMQWPLQTKYKRFHGLSFLKQ